MKRPELGSDCYTFQLLYQRTIYKSSFITSEKWVYVTIRFQVVYLLDEKIILFIIDLSKKTIVCYAIELIYGVDYLEDDLICFYIESNFLISIYWSLIMSMIRKSLTGFPRFWTCIGSTGGLRCSANNSSDVIEATWFFFFFCMCGYSSLGASFSIDSFASPLLSHLLIGNLSLIKHCITKTNAFPLVLINNKDLFLPEKWPWIIQPQVSDSNRLFTQVQGQPISTLSFKSLLSSCMHGLQVSAFPAWWGAVWGVGGGGGGAAFPVIHLDTHGLNDQWDDSNGWPSVFMSASNSALFMHTLWLRELYLNTSHKGGMEGFWSVCQRATVGSAHWLSPPDVNNIRMTLQYVGPCVSWCWQCTSGFYTYYASLTWTYNLQFIEHKRIISWGADHNLILWL